MGTIGNKFLELCKTKFQYLIEEYGFALKSASKKPGTIYKVVYQNKFVSIHINWEFRDNLIYMHIYKLFNGKLIRNPIIISRDSTLTGFDFENLLSLRSPKTVIDSRPKNIEDVERILTIFADLLRVVGSDVLRGDFSVMRDVEKLIKDRI